LDAFREMRLANTVHVARNGQEALDYVFGHGEYTDREAFPMPDLILLDLKLPGIDGHEVLRQIKGTPVLRRLPVIVLTSSDEESDRALSYDSGANSYLVKPDSFEGFLPVIRQIEEYWLILNVGPPE
jgi:CheY-like chemotaxis protein